MIIDNHFHRIISNFGYRLRALEASVVQWSQTWSAAHPSPRVPTSSPGICSCTRSTAAPSSSCIPPNSHQPRLFPQLILLALCHQAGPEPALKPSVPEWGAVGSLLCSSKLPDERRCVPCLLQAPPVLQYPAPCPLPPAGRPPYISAVFAANSGLTVSAGPLLLLGQVARGGTRPWQGCPPPPQNSAAQQSAPGSTFFV